MYNAHELLDHPQKLLLGRGRCASWYLYSRRMHQQASVVLLLTIEVQVVWRRNHKS